VSGFIVVVVLLGLAWLFIVLPVRRRQRATSELHEAMQDTLVVGDEIITAGGMYAVVREIDHDRLKIEIAPGVIVSLDRRAVAAVAEDEEAEVEAEDAEAQADEPEPENDSEPR
jgi:preprotein translocase subunit YajC